MGSIQSRLAQQNNNSQGGLDTTRFGSDSEPIEVAKRELSNTTKLRHRLLYDKDF